MENLLTCQETMGWAKCSGQGGVGFHFHDAKSLGVSKNLYSYGGDSFTGC